MPQPRKVTVRLRVLELEFVEEPAEAEPSSVRTVQERLLSPETHRPGLAKCSPVRRLRAVGAR